MAVATKPLVFSKVYNPVPNDSENRWILTQSTDSGLLLQVSKKPAQTLEVTDVALTQPGRKLTQPASESFGSTLALCSFQAAAA